MFSEEEVIEISKGLHEYMVECKKGVTRNENEKKNRRNKHIS